MLGFVLFLVSVASALAVVPTENLILKFGWDTDATDDLGVHNGTVTGATHLTSGCATGGCYYFDGNDKIEVTDHADLTLDTNFTILTWVKPNTTSGWASLFCKPSEATHSGDLCEYAIFRSGFDSDNWAARLGSDNDEVTGTSIQYNSWQLIGYTYDPDADLLRFYENAVNTDNKSFTNTPTDTPYNLKISTRQSDGEYFTGTIDEFLMFDVVLTPEQISEIYNNGIAYDILGSPPPVQADLDIETLKYTLPWNFSNSNNNLTIGENMPINFTVSNAGSNNTQANYSLIINDVSICSGTQTFNGESNTTITCNYTTTYGYHKANLTIDYDNSVNESNETNNELIFYIPLMNKGNYVPEYSTIISYLQNTSTKVAYSSYDFFNNFGSDTFDNGWDLYSVDPRAKNTLQWSYTCYLQNYNESHTSCIQANIGIKGWLNRTGWGTTSYMQQVHEIDTVIDAFEIMWKTFNETEYEEISQNMASVCTELTRNANTKPYTDTPLTPEFDNGKGFGIGIGSPCQEANGLYSENPALLNEQYYDMSSYIAWRNRQENFMLGWNNTEDAESPEGMLYKWYEQYHLFPDLYRRSLINDTYLIDNYQGTINAMAKESIYSILDHTYNGNTLRNDEDRLFRQISSGDTNSYERVGNDGIDGWTLITNMGLLTDNQTIKNALFYLRNKAYDTGEQTRGWRDTSMYYQLDQQTTTLTNLNDFQKVFNDTLNDKITIRTNYTYENDTVLIWSANQDRAYGHSDGYTNNDFVYVNGEPFYDYMQVPYEDNVRSEVFSNGISFTQNKTSAYSQTCGNAVLNLYYGMNDCVLEYGLKFPLQYSGDLTHIKYETDGSNAVAYRYTPMKDASEPIQEYKLKFGELYFEHSIVKDSPTNEIYHNWWNILEEFSADNNGSSVLFTNTNNSKQSRLSVLWSNETYNFTTQNSTIQYGFTKKESPTGKGYYQQTLLNISKPSAQFITLITLGKSNANQTITNIGTNDKGYLIDNNILIYFDTNLDGIINETGILTDAQAVAFNNETNESIGLNNTFLTVNGVNVTETSQEQEETPGDEALTDSSCDLTRTESMLFRIGIILIGLGAAYMLFKVDLTLAVGILILLAVTLASQALNFVC